MVSAKFMKGAQAPNVMDDNINDAANYDANDAVNDDADELWEREMDGADDQMEQIEKMMRPLTQVHPAAIIAGTIIAGKWPFASSPERSSRVSGHLHCKCVAIFTAGGWPFASRVSGLSHCLYKQPVIRESLPLPWVQ